MIIEPKSAKKLISNIAKIDQLISENETSLLQGEKVDLTLITEIEEVFETAILYRKFFNRISDLIHAYGILISIPDLLEEDEKIESISLGPNTSKGKYDLETDKRIYEFKFHLWDGGSNAARKKQLLKDYVNLVLADLEEAESKKEKKLLLYRKEDFIKADRFLNGNSSLQKNLSKNIYEELREKLNIENEHDFKSKFGTIRELHAKFSKNISLGYLKNSNFHKN
ncbi:MAG: hypothetical protein NXI01_10000 [Gammaproteobacteria bacterium]|uniref:hypothetical protein n=1 Tax=Phaeodactylibacter xiamenensis TaxID=1524460 RepID=UPI000696403F|nr:hypothetical protein [Phaeodactylibacter xiamenensis]MCR9192964.1 hypothetical protein [Gammaproteobacteria bacterium]